MENRQRPFSQQCCEIILLVQTHTKRDHVLEITPGTGLLVWKLLLLVVPILSVVDGQEFQVLPFLLRRSAELLDLGDL